MIGKPDTKPDNRPATVSPFCELTKEQWLLVARRNHPSWTEEQLDMAWSDFAKMKKEPA